MTFPPVPLYPLDYDSDETLFLVFNTSETRLAANNLPWSQELEIVPVGENEEEIWAENGFANISGELFYYGAVEKDSNGKVYKFKRCARNIGGKKTKFNPEGTWVRGYVIAEHHNQLADAIIKLEKFIGTLDCEDETSLCYRIKKLINEPTCDNDSDCPDVVFNVETITPSTNACEGTLINYNVEITGFFKNFQINFGDGNFTTSEQTGTHNYAPNAIIDPVVIVTSNNCQIVQTPPTRFYPEEPEITPETPTFEIPVPEIPEFPTCIIPDFEPRSTTFTLPPIQFPCELGFAPFGPVDIPSIIEFGPIDIPSIIEFGPVDIPSTIEFGPAPSFSPIDFGPAPSFSPIDFGPAPSFSPIDFGPAPSFSPIDFGPAPTFDPIDFGPPPTFSPIGFGPVNIPTTITVTDNIPNTINVTDNIPTTISVTSDLPDTIEITIGGGDLPSSIEVDWGSPPGISVDWGSPPPCSCTITVSCPTGGTSATSSAFAAQRARAMGSSIPDDFYDPFTDVEITSQDLGIPSEIRIIAPHIPDINIVHNLPEKIELIAPSIPKEIKLVSEIAIPSEILIKTETEIPTKIELVSDLPESLKLDASDLPEFIKLKLDLPENLPEFKINMPSEIQVVGLPDVIEIKGMPSEITIKPPENYEIPLVYKGGPIPVEFDFKTPSGNAEDMPCFTLVPCNK